MSRTQNVAHIERFATYVERVGMNSHDRIEPHAETLLENREKKNVAPTADAWKTILDSFREL